MTMRDLTSAIAEAWPTSGPKFVEQMDNDEQSALDEKRQAYADERQALREAETPKIRLLLKELKKATGRAQNAAASADRKTEDAFRKLQSARMSYERRLGALESSLQTSVGPQRDLAVTGLRALEREIRKTTPSTADDGTLFNPISGRYEPKNPHSSHASQLATLEAIRHDAIPALEALGLEPISGAELKVRIDEITAQVPDPAKLVKVA